MSKITFTEEIITPAIATYYLSLMGNNKKLRQETLMRYVQDIRNGRWKSDTGESIKFSKSGRLIDGQHRLNAIIIAGMTLVLLVARGLDDEVFDVLDTGSKRTACDIFKIKGIKYDTLIPSMMVTYNSIKENGKTGSGSNITKTVRPKNTNAALLEAYYNDPLFWEHVATKTFTFYRYIDRLLTPSFIGGLYAVLYKINNKMADDFMHQLCKGDAAVKPITLARQILYTDGVSKTSKLTLNTKLAYIVKAWNLFVKGNNSIKSLRFDPAKEEFPKISRPI